MSTASIHTVIGSGSVYLTDARGAIDSNISDATGECALSVFGVRLHVLAATDAFDIATRRRSSQNEESRLAA